MKATRALVAGLSALSCSVANAATLSVVKSADQLTNTVYLNGAPENGSFNTIILNASPLTGTFINQNTGLAAGLPRPPGQPFTYRNGFLNADPTDPEIVGGMGWSLLGTVSTAAQFAFTAGPLGANISTANAPSGNLFLVNFQMSSGGASRGAVTVKLVNAAGIQVGADLTAQIGIIPEPTSIVLLATAILGLAGSRRRYAS